MKNETNKSKLFLILSMIIFGTIGIFRKYIPIPSGALAMFRGIIGAIFLLAIIFISRKKLNIKAIKENLILLIISGALIGFNWILLFEAYNYTSVATATLCYYMAPVFVIFASPIFLKENLTLKQLMCSVFAILGMVLVSGIFEVGLNNISEFWGVLLGLGAAALYASVIIINKKLTNVNSFERTIIQLAAAGITIIPYTVLFEENSTTELNINVVLLILFVGLIHTGIAYALYFGSIKNVKAQTAAIYSYIDPIVATILSVVVLNEKMSLLAVTGAIIVLGATLISEIDFKKVRSK